MRKLIALMLLVSAAAAQAQTRTPDEVLKSLDGQVTGLRGDVLTQLADIEARVAELRGVLFPKVTTSSELTARLLRGGVIDVAPGLYTGNFVIAVDGTVLRAPDGLVTLKGADVLHNAVVITGSKVLVDAGITVQAVAADRAVVLIGSPSAGTPEQQPDDVTLDGITVLATAAGGKRGIEAHTRRFRLANSYVLGFFWKGQDSQAFYSCNGPGPYTLENNTLEGSGENVMFGGGTIKSALMVPSDIIVRRNLIRKPLEWRLTTGTVKNSLEFKSGKRVLVEGNTFDGCWKDGQVGNMIVLTPRNQTGDSPWAEVSDVMIRGNHSKNHINGAAVSLLAVDNNYPSQRTARISIVGNLFQDSPNGVLISGGITDWLVITDNTFPAIKGNLLQFTGTLGVLTPLTFARNVGKSGPYGIAGDGTTPGGPTLPIYTTLVDWSGNVIEKTGERYIAWPAGTTLLPVGGLALQLNEEFHFIPGGAGW